jgi:RNA polymerase sigma-70 factor (ECF subfamily)
MSDTLLALDTRSLDPRVPAEHQDFAALVAAHGNDLRRYAVWLAGDRHVAEDLVQETLLRAWKSLHRLHKPQAAKSWLLTILRRENARRFERQSLPESKVPTEALPGGPPAYDTSTAAFVLRQALRELPEEYREPLLLQVVHGYSQQEIADRLGISPGGVGTRLFRARHRLRAALGD